MKFISIAFAFLLSMSSAKADPILTPLVATAFTTVGISSSFTIAGVSAVAITTSALTLGAPLPIAVLKVQR